MIGSEHPLTTSVWDPKMLSKQFKVVDNIILQAGSRLEND